MLKYISKYYDEIIYKAAEYPWKNKKQFNSCISILSSKLLW